MLVSVSMVLDQNKHQLEMLNKKMKQRDLISKIFSLVILVSIASIVVFNYVFIK